ncbi:NACHT domain-containing protein [Streptomyces griseoluteus]|uniref:NACHT domain-containing protein n=1 Tax=Streptomyces griseoluteus TaxID=29306 RepID=UPI0034260E6A
MATNQVLNDGKLSWTWLYASLCVSVLSLLYSEVGAGGAGDPGTAQGGRRVYLRQLRASVRDMETVGIATQSEYVFRMRQVYVDVSVIPQVLHAAAREPYVGRADGSERRSLASVLREGDGAETSRVLAVIGGPGSGKTTLARNTALELCAHRWRPWKRRLPVLLYLRDHASVLLTDEPPALETVAVSAAWLDGKVPARWLARRLDRGECVVLLDGLDEVADPAERGRVVGWVARQVQRHPRNTYVVTSRPHGYETNPLPGAEVLQVRRFTWEQIERFLRQWSYATESRARGTTGPEVRAAADRTATDLLVRLRRQPALYDLAANPLLLTMTANVHRYRGQLPGSRAELYAEMCDVLLHRRSEARGLTDATGLTGPHKQHVAQHLALAMMRARVRDWPVRDAARAIRLALRQVPGRASAEVFLEEARKSGLLVEREHHVYGFAHLTLQEYLAAAQLSTPHADTNVLTENVDSPWWRETILLWSAANDATLVITACLNNDTVPALALAFDCAEEARTVDPDTRSRLESLLTPPGPNEPRDPPQARLVAQILATRSLRETVRIDDTTTLCARPVPPELYAAFVNEERAAGRHYPAQQASPEGAPRPAVGMQAGDAERFLEWANSLAVAGEGVYRLPTLEELNDQAALSIIPPSHTVWTHDGSETRLHQPDGATWPYTHPADQAEPVIVADLERIALYLRLMATPVPRRARVDAWTKVLTTALTHASALRAAPPMSALKLPLLLGMAAAVEQFRLLAEDREGAPALLQAFGVAHTFTRAVETVPVQELSLNLDPILARALDHAHSALATHATEMLDPSTSRDRVLHIARNLNLDPALGRVFRHSQGFQLDRALEHARGFDDELVRRLDCTLEAIDAFDPLTAPAFSPFLAVQESLRLTSRHNPWGSGLDLAVDLAVSITNACGTQVLTVAHGALRSLLRQIDFSSVAPSDLTVLHDFLAARVRAARQRSIGPFARAVEDPFSLLRIQRDTPPPAGPHALEPVPGLAYLLAQMRDRSIPWDERTLSCARTALSAAMGEREGRGWSRSDRSGPLYLVWHGLTALEASLGSPTANQILLLARSE